MSENGSVKSIDSKSALRETGVVTGFVLDSDSDAKAVVDVATNIITDKAKPANDLKDLFIRIPLFPIEIEKKTADGEYKIIFKSSEVEDIDKAVAKTIQQIKKL